MKKSYENFKLQKNEIRNGLRISCRNEKFDIVDFILDDNDKELDSNNINVEYEIFYWGCKMGKMPTVKFIIDKYSLFSKCYYSIIEK